MMVIRRIQDVFELVGGIPPVRVTDREYLYGPDDLDELLMVADLSLTSAHPNRRMYVLQDANLNVMALTNASGVPIQQYTNDAYGQVIATEQFRQHAVKGKGMDRHQ